MSVFKYILLLVILGIIFSCEKKIDKVLPENNFNDIIIDAFIIDEYKNQEIKLSVPGLNQNDSLIPISEARVFIKGDNKIYYFTESDSLKGYYFSDSLFAPVIGVNYYLEVGYKSKKYTAETFMLPVKQFVPLTYALDADHNEYKITWVANVYDPGEQAMYEVLINPNNDNDSLNIRAFYYSFNTVDVSQAFANDPVEIYFPHGSKIIEKKYSLTPEYAKYLRALASETMWQGTVFSEAPSNLPTNIEGGAMGFFSVCAVSSIEINIP